MISTDSVGIHRMSSLIYLQEDPVPLKITYDVINVCLASGIGGETLGTSRLYLRWATWTASEMCQ